MKWFWRLLGRVECPTCREMQLPIDIMGGGECVVCVVERWRREGKLSCLRNA